MNSLRLGLALCVGISVLSACGGGGGGPAGPTVPTATATPSPGSATATPTAAPVTTPTPTAAPTATGSAAAVTPAVQRQVAQADFQIVRPLLIETQLEQGLDASSLGHRSALARAHRMTAGSCNDGTEFSSSSSGSVANFTLDFFYDTACTMLWQNIAGTETATSSSSESISATDTIDGKNGMQVEYDSITGTLSSTNGGESFSVNASAGPTASDATAQLAANCSIAQTSQTTASQSCVYGDLATLPAFMGYTGFGTLLSDMANITQTSSGYSAAGTGSATFYEGTASMMALTNDGTTIGISGATTSKNLTETETITATGGSPTAMVTVTDSADNALVTFDLSNYTITGSIENATTKTVSATFTLDVNGNGTITYSNGSTGTVTAFGIVS